jgi:hypothetical protein
MTVTAVVEVDNLAVGPTDESIAFGYESYGRCGNRQRILTGGEAQFVVVAAGQRKPALVFFGT